MTECSDRPTEHVMADGLDERLSTEKF